MLSTNDPMCRAAMSKEPIVPLSESRLSPFTGGVPVGGAIGPLAQTVVAPHAATLGVLSDAEDRILCMAWLDVDPDRSPYRR